MTEILYWFVGTNLSHSDLCNGTLYPSALIVTIVLEVDIVIYKTDLINFCCIRCNRRVGIPLARILLLPPWSLPPIYMLMVQKTLRFPSALKYRDILAG